MGGAKRQHYATTIGSPFVDVTVVDGVTASRPGIVSTCTVVRDIGGSERKLRQRRAVLLEELDRHVRRRRIRIREQDVRVEERRDLPIETFG